MTNEEDLQKTKIDSVIHFKLIHKEAKLPTKAHGADIGYDVFAVHSATIEPHGSARMFTGLQLANITPLTYISVESRSGLGINHDIIAFPGIIDTNYRGEIFIKLFNFGNEKYQVKAGDRICQFVIKQMLCSILLQSDNVTETERGSNGLGSTNR